MEKDKNKHFFLEVGLHVRLFLYYCTLVNERKTRPFLVVLFYYIKLIIKQIKICQN